MGLISGGILVFVDVMKELPLTLLLKPYGIMTLSVKAFEYASDERIAESALPALFIIATGLIPIILLNRLINA
jgi:iron(III) transport system permease protein